jgi:hypothetical protein
MARPLSRAIYYNHPDCTKIKHKARSGRGRKNEGKMSLRREKLYLKAVALAATLLFGVGAVDSLAQTRKPTIKRATTRRVVAKRYLGFMPCPLALTSERGSTSRSAQRPLELAIRFTATVTEPVYSSNGVLVVPQGSTLTGRVDAVMPARKGGKPERSMSVSDNCERLVAPRE